MSNKVLIKHVHRRPKNLRTHIHSKKENMHKQCNAKIPMSENGKAQKTERLTVRFSAHSNFRRSGLNEQAKSVRKQNAFGSGL